MEEATYIYALTDPETEEVRYIGKTIYKPADRLKSHIGGAQAGDRGHKNNWIRKLLSTTLRPDISVLEIVFYPDDWQEREKWWITFAKEQGFRLTNICDGGEGMPGYKHTDKAKCGIGKASQERERSKEHCRRISESRKGMVFSDEHKRNIGKAHAKSYPAFVNEVTGEFIPAGINLCAMCEERGLNYAGMGHVKTGSQRSYKNWIVSEEKK